MKIFISIVFIFYPITTFAQNISLFPSNGYTAPTHFPHHVFLSTITVTQRTIYCGGSIITQEYVLTAASCIEQYKEIELGFGGLQQFFYAKSLKSLVAIPHWAYNPKTLAHNIALIRLPEKLIFSDLIQPIELMFESLKYDTMTGMVCGHGLESEYSPRFGHLKWAHITMINNHVCSKFFRSIVISPQMLCAFRDDIENSSEGGICAGDGGSSVLLVESNRWTKQIAVINFISKSRCSSSEPFGSTIISPYRIWITSITSVGGNDAYFS